MTLLVVLLLLAGAACYLAAVPVVAWRSVSRVDATPDGPRPPDQPGTTYLLVGVDSRAELSAAERRRLSTGAGGGSRADTIMLLHVGSGPPVLVSVPRASLVHVPGHGLSMVNAAYAYGGPELLVASVEEATGIRVDAYVEVGFEGLVRAVDAVGGIPICPPRAMADRRAGLDVDAGCQEADGVTALAYARSRHAQRLDDIARATHQREVAARIASSAASLQTVLDPRRYWDVATGAVAAVRVGDDVGLEDVARAAWALRHVTGGGGLACTVPLTDADVQIVHWDTASAERLFGLIARDGTAEIGDDLCHPTGFLDGRGP